MGLPTVREYELLKGRVEELETRMVSLLAKLDVDTGVADENYETSQAPAITRSWDVTNDYTAALRFDDLTGKEYLLDAGDTVTIMGMTDELLAWEGDGKISKVATP